MSPYPLHSFLGGLGLPIPIQSLMLLNGNVLGISGFIHRGVRGAKEAMAGMAGLVIGGAVVGLVERKAPGAIGIGLPKIVLAGLCIGLGSRMANGCTSGHMLAGVSRFSARSLVATATFMGAGAIAAYLFHNDLPVGPAMSWSVTPTAQRLLILQTVPLLASVLLYFLSPPTTADHNQGDKPSPPNTSLRILAFLSTTIQFALSLRLSELTDPRRVISFLLLPVHKAWDPSLAFLAAGALPLAMVLYRYARGNEKPRLGGAWCIPTNTVIDRRLVGGSALFGVGWGLAGICPGPGLVNLGRMVTGGASASAVYETAAWLGAVVVGGMFA